MLNGCGLLPVSPGQSNSCFELFRFLLRKDVWSCICAGHPHAHGMGRDKHIPMLGVTDVMICAGIWKPRRGVCSLAEGTREACLKKMVPEQKRIKTALGGAESLIEIPTWDLPKHSEPRERKVHHGREVNGEEGNWREALRYAQQV